jgi:hypothetical protein
VSQEVTTRPRCAKKAAAKRTPLGCGNGAVGGGHGAVVLLVGRIGRARDLVLPERQAREENVHVGIRDCGDSIIYRQDLWVCWILTSQCWFAYRTCGRTSGRRNHFRVEVNMMAIQSRLGVPESHYSQKWLPFRSCLTRNDRSRLMMRPPTLVEYHDRRKEWRGESEGGERAGTHVSSTKSWSIDDFGWISFTTTPRSIDPSCRCVTCHAVRGSLLMGVDRSNHRRSAESWKYDKLGWIGRGKCPNTAPHRSAPRISCLHKTVQRAQST